MSLYGMMRTGVSGMSAQANRLSTVADNIANANTTGYKRSKTEFSSLVVPSTPGAYSSGGVKTSVRYDVSTQGVLQYTTSGSDLAVYGDGFMAVQDASGANFFARAGSFVPDGEGHFVNAAGFYLLGHDYSKGEPTPGANSLDGFDKVRISHAKLTVTPSIIGTVRTGNLPSTSAIVPAASLPSGNPAAGASFSAKTSLAVYDNLGGEVLVDVYFTRTGTSTWEVATYNQADAAPGTTFPYASGPLAVETLEFDPANGSLTAASPKTISFMIPGGRDFTLDMANMTQLASSFDPDIQTDGSGPSSIQAINISEDGVVYAQYENGDLHALYKIPLVTVPSPDNLTVLPGNVYALSSTSGEMRVGYPNDKGFGSVISGALEGSNVDIAEELTDMIEAQRNYTANSKVFQTGSDLLDILVNLKR